MSLTMQDIIAKVGKGEKTSKDLTYQEATAALRLLLEKHATPVQVGAFLLAMRIKSESVAELAALASAARGYVEPLPIPLTLGVVDIPTDAGKPDGLPARLPAARLMNPARASVSIIGISHPPYFEKIAEALRMMGSPRALILRGVEGEPELSISSVTKAIELRDDRITPLTIHPKDVGMLPGR